MLVLGDSVIRHRVNGQTVFEYTKPHIGGGNVSDYNPDVKVDGKPLKDGYISLQSESHPIEFRTVKLFDLEKYMGKPDKLQNMIERLQKHD
jgi:hypothetical protein